MQVIKNYNDLVAEKERLKKNIRLRKAHIGEGVDSVKQAFNPIAQVAGTTKAIFNSERQNPLISFGVSRLTDFLFGKLLLKRTGFLGRLVIPVVVRRISTYLIASNFSDKAADTLHAFAQKLRKTNLPDKSSKKQ
ncbi:MAG: hypothetical protein QM727_00505 [Niabella sp.]